MGKRKVSNQSRVRSNKRSTNRKSNVKRTNTYRIKKSKKKTHRRKYNNSHKTIKGGEGLTAAAAAGIGLGAVGVAGVRAFRNRRNRIKNEGQVSEFDDIEPKVDSFQLSKSEKLLEKQDFSTLPEPSIDYFNEDFEYLLMNGGEADGVLSEIESRTNITKVTWTQRRRKLEVLLRRIDDNVLKLLTKGVIVIPQSMDKKLECLGFSWDKRLLTNKYCWHVNYGFVKRVTGENYFWSSGRKFDKRDTSFVLELIADKTVDDNRPKDYNYPTRNQLYASLSSGMWEYCGINALLAEKNLPNLFSNIRSNQLFNTFVYNYDILSLIKLIDIHWNIEEQCWKINYKTINKKYTDYSHYVDDYILKGYVKIKSPKYHLNKKFSKSEKTSKFTKNKSNLRIIKIDYDGDTGQYYYTFELDGNHGNMFEDDLEGFIETNDYKPYSI